MLLTTEQSSKLERIARYRTRYELLLAHPDGRRYLVQYTEGRSRRAILDCVRKVGDSVVQVIGDHPGKPTSCFRFADKGFHGHKATIGDWVVEFSGRTQRDCILTGELPFVGSVG